MSARERPDQQQVADIGARDQKHKDYDSEHDPERWQQSSRAVERRLPQGPEPEPAAAIGRRIIIFQAFRHGGKFLLGLPKSDTRLQPGVPFNPTLAPVFEFVTAGLKRV